MKKSILGLLCAFAGIIAGALGLLLIINNVPEARELFVKESHEEAAAAEKRDLVDIALELAGHMKNGDYEAVSEVVHPEYGVYFSPSAKVTLSSNKRFTTKEVAKFGSDDTNYVWGVESDIGSPIDITAADYFASYVFDSDYTSPAYIGVNNIVKSGNDLDNVKDVFPEAEFVDLYNPGTKEQEYADWSILRLVFEEYNGQYKLVAVIHSEASI